MDLLERKVDQFPKNHQREINILLGKRDLLLRTLKQVYHHKIDADKLRPHGNYELHSLLFVDGDFIITNFEGDFSLSLTERRLRKPVLVDIASMLASFHFVAYSALYQNEPSGLLAEFWFHHISQIFLAHYFDAVDGTPLAPEKKDFNILLITFLLEKYLAVLGDRTEEGGPVQGNHSGKGYFQIASHHRLA